MNNVAGHFNKIADQYDVWKKKNWYYYQTLKELVQQHVQAGKNVLEIGTGTGDILAGVAPQVGIGLDISLAMIELAQKKHQDRANLKFYCCAPAELPEHVVYNYIMLIDVVEHLEDINGMVRQIKAVTSAKTEIFISMANPLWEPILMMAEKLKLKMPEGKHYRISARKLIGIFRDQDIILVKHGFRLLIPLYMPFISQLINHCFYATPLIRRLGLVEYFVFRLDPGKSI